jgi:hypothetical protein
MNLRNRCIIASVLSLLVVGVWFHQTSPSRQRMADIIELHDHPRMAS